MKSPRGEPASHVREVRTVAGGGGSSHDLRRELAAPGGSRNRREGAGTGRAVAVEGLRPHLTLRGRPTVCFHGSKFSQGNADRHSGLPQTSENSRVPRNTI